MKQNKFWGISAFALVCAVLVTACRHPTNPTKPDPQQGYGTVSIIFEGGNARTLLPSEFDLPKLYYVLAFTQTDGSGNITETQNGSGQLTLQLPVGTYNLDIRGYNSPSDAANTANAVVFYVQNNIAVPYGDSVTINAKLLPNLDNLTQTGSGTLRYDITFPSGAAGVLKVYTYPANTQVGNPVVLSATVNRGKLELASGYYDISVNIEYQGKIKTWSELAHINDNAITEAIVGPDDFTDYLPSPGPVDIYLSMDKFTMTDEGAGVFAGISPIALDKRTGDIRTISVDSLVVVEWQVGDVILGTGNNITLSATVFPSGIYTLNLAFLKNGKYWLGSIRFEVTVTGNLPDDYFELITDSGGIWWGTGERIDRDRTGTYRVIGSSTVPPPDKVYIPAYYNGLPVTEIGMRSVGEGSYRGAFMYESNITDVYIPDTVTYIGGYSFMGCTNLISITLSTNVDVIGDQAFDSCGSLTSIIIPEGVKLIASDAFSNCTSLTSITIPASVRGLGGGTGGAFGNCSNLTSIYVDNNNPYYTSEGGMVFNKAKTTLLAFPSASGAVTIPESVTIINNSTFRGSNLTSVTIPTSVEIIMPHAFAECQNLTSVIIPEGVIYIEQGAFMFCRNLISVTIPASVTYIGSRVFGDGCDSLTSVTFLGTIDADNIHYNLDYSYSNAFPGDLRDKYLAGGIGTYTTTNPGDNAVWTKQ